MEWRVELVVIPSIVLSLATLEYSSLSRKASWEEWRKEREEEQGSANSHAVLTWYAQYTFYSTSLGLSLVVWFSSNYIE